MALLRRYPDGVIVAEGKQILDLQTIAVPLKMQAVQLAWANTRGGWDYLRFDGRKLKTVTREEKTYRKQIGDYNASSFSFGSTDREITPYQVEAKESYQLNGILTSEEYDLFQYCFRSKNIMARIDGTWVSRDFERVVSTSGIRYNVQGLYRYY